MSLQKYMAFLMTVEHGSFTRAAQVLGYTQSGISHMIRELEAQWGVSLLDRSPAGVQLTSDGLRLLPHVREVCAAERTLGTALDELRGLRGGILRIGTFSSVATHWLPNIVRAFQLEYPAVEFEFLLGDYTEIERWVLEGRVDCGFLRLPAGPGLQSIYLEEDRLLAVLPEEHPYAGRSAFPVGALEEFPFLLLEKGGKAEMSAIFEQHGLTPKIRFTTWDDYAVLAMVEAGLGISILPELILRRIPYRVVAKELSPPAHRSIGLVLKDQKTASLATRRFLEYLDCRGTAAPPAPECGK